MSISVWFGLIFATATVVGLFAGYLNKPKEVTKEELIVHGIGAIMFFMIFGLTLILPQAERRPAFLLGGYITWCILVLLGIYLGKKLRGYHNRTGPRSPNPQAIFWHD